ncbi:DUF3105 domain-containing protein [Deinococcus radiomollis]|uniref:DUF3105 domain-containing protein n=1 Tax=Deinococcus radiomollis TaxID=468916 RepID=UPI003891608D
MKWTLLLALPLIFASCAKTDSLSAVQTFKYASGEHQEGQIAYTEHPPVGGKHNPRWQKCGVYTQPLYDQFAVHSMEHGAVWITYLPSLAAADVGKLKADVNGRSYTLLSPYPGQKSPVVLSAWNAQLPLDSASDPRIKDFLSKYEQGATAPERGAACDGPYSVTETQ